MTRRRRKPRRLLLPRTAPFRAVEAEHWQDRFEAERERVDQELRSRVEGFEQDQNEAR